MELTVNEQLFFENQQKKETLSLSSTLSDKVDALLGCGKIVSTIKCIKCGSHDVSYEHKQTRAIDEGMTTFFTCRSCKTRWKD